MVRALIAVVGVLTGPAFIACSVALLMVWAWRATGQEYGTGTNPMAVAR